MNCVLTGAVAMIATATAAHAAALNFTTPGFRGVNPNAEYAGFESFTVPFGGPNFPDDPTSNGLPATLTQNTMPDFSMPPGILISGDGNMYSGFQSLDLTLADIAASPIRTVILQVRTLGTELFYGGVGLSYVDGNGATQTLTPDVSRQLSRVSGPPIMGFPTDNVEWRFKWDLSGLADDVSAYEIGMTHFAPHLSLDRIELDTLSIPAPASVVLLGVAMAGPLRRRR
ncbi:MAG: hypothetical protein KDA21_07765 [Phycisphaerales bacterium]|nr:hypothetical protein [Phycisphaerales bacterium]